MLKRGTRLLAIAAGVLLLTGCGLRIPADPDGTLDRITGGELRVGVSEDAGLIEIGSGGEVTGPLADLVDGFAERHDARVTWVPGSEETLVVGLEEGGLDLAVGGMTRETAWIDRVGITRGYPGIPGSDGRELVLFVPLGENALLSDLETYLDEEVGS